MPLGGADLYFAIERVGVTPAQLFHAHYAQNGKVPQRRFADKELAGFIEKPFGAGELTAMVRRVLEL